MVYFLRFLSECGRRVDANIQALYVFVVGGRWLSVRLGIVGSCIVFSAALFAVLGRETLSPGVVGLSINVALQVKSLTVMTLSYIFNYLIQYHKLDTSRVNSH